MYIVRSTSVPASHPTNQPIYSTSAQISSARPLSLSHSLSHRRCLATLTIGTSAVSRYFTSPGWFTLYQSPTFLCNAHVLCIRQRELFVIPSNETSLYNYIFIFSVYSFSSLTCIIWLHSTTANTRVHKKIDFLY